MSFCRLSNALNRSANNAPHFPICEDAFSILQTLQLMNVENYKHFDNLVGILICYQYSFKFSCKGIAQKFQTIWLEYLQVSISYFIVSVFFFCTKMISANFSSLEKLAVFMFSLKTLDKCWEIIPLFNFNLLTSISA